MSRTRCTTREHAYDGQSIRGAYEWCRCGRSVRFVPRSERATLPEPAPPHRERPDLSHSLRSQNRGVEPELLAVIRSSAKEIVVVKTNSCGEQPKPLSGAGLHAAQNATPLRTGVVCASGAYSESQPSTPEIDND